MLNDLEKESLETINPELAEGFVPLNLKDLSELGPVVNRYNTSFASRNERSNSARVHPFDYAQGKSVASFWLLVRRLPNDQE